MSAPIRLRGVVLVLATASLCLPVRAAAQAGEGQVSGRTVGGFSVQGDVSIGVRATSISGREEKYRELFNLGQGLRLVDFELFGQAPRGQAGLFADTFSLSASGLGGDPFPSVQVTARKRDRYDFRATWRQSRYVWDRPSVTVPGGLNGTEANHAFDTRRDLGSANLLVHVTDGLRAGFEVQRANREGLTVATRTPEFFGAPGTWGNFARANPYLMAAPLTQTSSRYAGSLDYTRAGWTVHYNAGYQTFDDSVLATALEEPEVSINVDDASTSQEILQHGAYQDYRRLTTPVSELSYAGDVRPDVRWNGSYTFYRYRGPAGLQAAYSGLARSGAAFVPYALSFDTRADVTEPTHSVQQGLTWKATDAVNVLVDYRYTHTAIDSTARFHSLFNTTPADGEADMAWRQNRNQVGVDVEVLPASGLLVRGGLRVLQNDVRVLADGALDEARTKIIRTVWPTVSVYYRPSRLVSVRADFDEISRDTSYTRITPHTEVGSRVLVKLHPTDALSIENSLTVRKQTLDTTDYTARIRGNAIVATYTYSDNFALHGGYSYDDVHAQGMSVFLRGTAPLDVAIDDRETNHVWQGGVAGRLARTFGFDVAGNYVKSTGVGAITGEDPRYGPLTMPMVTGTVYCDLPGAGRLSVDVQRVRYTERIIGASDFSARMVMVRWTRGF